MKFLLVLRPKEIEQYWHERLGEKITEKGGEFEVRNSVEEAKTLLADQQYEIHEVISGTFGAGRLDGPWRMVQASAAERGIGFTLLTSVGVGISPQDAARLREAGVSVIDKIEFDDSIGQFLDQRFPVGVQKEIK